MIHLINTLIQWVFSLRIRVNFLIFANIFEWFFSTLKFTKILRLSMWNFSLLVLFRQWASTFFQHSREKYASFCNNLLQNASLNFYSLLKIDVETINCRVLLVLSCFPSLIDDIQSLILVPWNFGSNWYFSSLNGTFLPKKFHGFLVKM